MLALPFLFRSKGLISSLGVLGRAFPQTVLKVFPFFRSMRDGETERLS